LLLDLDYDEPAAPMWSFVTIFQMALIKSKTDVTGGTLHSGGLISRAVLDEVRDSLAAGHEGELVLRGITTCSRLESVAVGFAGRATPTATMVRVIYRISMRDVPRAVVIARQLGMCYGPAVSVEQFPQFPEEKAVMLLDGTVLRVSPGHLRTHSRTAVSDGVGPHEVECVQIKATVDWDPQCAQVALCNQAKPGAK
jgi:hypothetical protein